MTTPRNPRLLSFVALTIAITSCTPPTGGLEPGECTTAPSTDSEYFVVDEVDCEDPHFLEVYAIVDLDPPEEMPFPGHQEAGAAYQELCEPLFEEYVGASVAASPYKPYTVYPSRSSWDEGATGGWCLVARWDTRGELVEVTGSAEGSGS